MTTALVKSTPRKLTKSQLYQLSTYTDPAVILATLKKEGWTVKKAIHELVDIVENTDKDSTRLAALKYLNQMIIDCMERSGMMVIATKRIAGEEGEEVTFTGHVLSSVLQGPSDKQTTIEQLTGDDYPPDVEEPKDDTEKKPKKQGKTKTTSRGKGTTAKNRKRTKRDSKRGREDSSTASVSGRGTRTTNGGGGTTEAGLSDDLHTSKYPEVHLDSFQGLAVPPSTNRSGPADNDTL